MAYSGLIAFRGTGAAPETLERPSVEDRAGDDRGRVLACARCATAVTTTAARRTMAGSHEHTFANPHGIVFRIGCFAEASCRAEGEPSRYWTWFPGFDWRTEWCLLCGQHLGWVFESAAARFHGLVLDRLVQGGPDGCARRRARPGR